MTDTGGKSRLDAIHSAMSEIEKQFGKGEIMSLQRDESNKTIGYINKIDISNYKSIKSGSVVFSNLTILVGMNGSGKSNLLDAITFISDSLTNGLEHAVNSRGGITSLVRNSNRLGLMFSIKLTFTIPSGSRCTYKIKIKRAKHRELDIAEEVVTIDSKTVLQVINGKYEVYSGNKPPYTSATSLALPTLSGTDAFLPIYKLLSSIRFYAPNIEAIRSLALPDNSSTLKKGAENIASMIHKAVDFASRQKISKYLNKVNPVIRGYIRRKFGKMEAVNFTISNSRYYLYPDSVSDGTLRAFALLVAIFQDEWRGVPKLSLICIEEPETGLHPTAAAVMMEALEEASKTRQILLTTHSADILENVNPDETNIVYTSLTKENATKFSPISQETKQIIRENLYNPGELLKMGQLL